MRSLILLVSYDHMDNNHKEILVYIYFASIVYNQPKKSLFSFPKCQSTIYI